jgi:hypothetical protein
MSCYTHHTFLLGFPTGWSFTTYQLCTIERKLQAAHVAEVDWVTFTTYHLEGAAGSWWENFLAM